VVVVPAHNEFAALFRSVSAIRTAAIAVAVPTSVVVVLDACDDESALTRIRRIAQDWRS
jgi:nitrate reductase NapAB chaperone NapD